MISSVSGIIIDNIIKQEKEEEEAKVKEEEMAKFLEDSSDDESEVTVERLKKRIEKLMKIKKISKRDEELAESIMGEVKVIKLEEPETDADGSENNSPLSPEEVRKIINKLTLTYDLTVEP